MSGTICCHEPTLCWDCANAVPNRDGTRGCSWSLDFKPVEGWEAEERKLLVDSIAQKRVTTYHVINCPEFVEG